MSSTEFKGVVFDLDGVVTATAKVHAKAWGEMFNAFLKEYTERENMPFLPFDPTDDYLRFVDGKPRYEGVKSFLEARGIVLPYGEIEGGPDKETVCGLGNRKNELFKKYLAKDGAEVFASSVEFIRDLKRHGIRVGVATSSRNCDLILERAGLADIFETRVDGVLSLELGLKGKPDPDIFTLAASNLGLTPGECVVVEDAISGVQAGCNGNFGLVLGLARNVEGGLLKRFGADMVVGDLSEITVRDIEVWFQRGVQAAGWELRYDGFDPGDEKLRETLTTVGNGYLGARGCFEGERASFHFYPGTYIAGVYNRLPSVVHGKEIYNNDLVNCPNWLLLEFKVGSGDFVSPLSMELLSYCHRLDMRRGLLLRSLVCRDKLGRITRIHSSRLASMADPHICALKYELTPCNYSEKITIRSSLDGDVINDGVARYRQLNSRHLSIVEGGEAAGGLDNEMFLHVETSRSLYQIVMAGRTTVFENNRAMPLTRLLTRRGGLISQEMAFNALENTTYAVEKLVTVHTSLDQDQDDPVAAAVDRLNRVKDFASVLRAHVRTWEKLWEKADMVVDGDRFVQMAARLHTYHLLATASPHNVDLDAGMPARGLSGEAYRGHIFWDELYIFGFFDRNLPKVTRALLMYRYNRLDAARLYARENGCQGAMYPWQTADDGDEETQEVHYNPESDRWGPDNSRRQRHVSIAVFYNIWRYVVASGDEKFLRKYGAEMMLEIARCWASMAEYDPDLDRYSIAGVMGPDEFHEKMPGSEEPGLKDNAYTNVMVVWLLEKTLELLDSLPAESLELVAAKIGFEESEAEKWRDMTKKLNVVITEDGVISQFDGYMALPELDWESYRKRYYSIHRMDRILKAENDSPDNYKVAKQADTLMMFYVIGPYEVCRILRQLGHEVGDPLEFLRRNYDFYESRTSHGSTLSKVVHAAISSLAHEDEKPWNWFMEAMQSDIYDTQGGTTIEGIHTGVMAGTLDVIVKCFARLDLGNEIPRINPRLPVHWNGLSFRFKHGRSAFAVEINKRTVRVTALGTGTRKRVMEVAGQRLELAPGESRERNLA